MTRAMLRRGVRKRRAAREARERKARRPYPRCLAPPPLELSEGPAPWRHSWFDLPTYGEIDGEPGRYQLEWFS